MAIVRFVLTLLRFNLVIALSGLAMFPLLNHKGFDRRKVTKLFNGVTEHV
jgi:hypothetical protein